jgi:hypothetical protein
MQSHRVPPARGHLGPVEPFLGAESLVAYGGDTGKARDLLTRAHATAAAHRYATVERRAAAALQGLP